MDKPVPSDQLTEREKEILARLAAGLSDQRIADDLFLSPNTVRWYNRQIYSKLGVGSRTQAIALSKSLGLLERAPSTPPPVLRHHLPAQTTSFIGRKRESAEILRLLDSGRLVTLTGTGGIGKTRLALDVAAQAEDDFADGVYFVDLAPLADPARVANAIASALGVVENSAEPLPETLKRVLASQHVLLLIDNFEHVIAAAPMVSDLLTACPFLKILVTSRESLRLLGEREYEVLPLSLPSLDVDSADQLVDSEAALLFIQRAQMIRPRFAVGDENVPVIARICTRLGGLPLAIELAAARSKVLSPVDLLDRLDGTKVRSPLQTLGPGWRDAPPRQRTLRASIEWSYDLLNAGERKLLVRLAVFRGGFCLEAAESVCGQDLSIDVFDGLASLIDKSLMQQRSADETEPRFTLLEMIHEYAQEQLDASGETETLRQRHAEYFVSLAERAEPELRLARYDEWCRRFELEFDNLRAVLNWSLSTGQLPLGGRLASALCLFWYGKGHHVEGIYWMRQLLERLDEVPFTDLAKFLFGAGHMVMLANLDQARPLFERMLAGARSLDDRLQAAWALIFIGYTLQRDAKAAMPLVEEGLALFREQEHLPGVAQALNIVGEIARLSGDDGHARTVYEECLLVCQQTGEVHRTFYLYQNLAYLAQHESDYDRAAHLGYQALQLARSRQDRRDMALSLATLTGAVGMAGQPHRAARLLGAAEAASEKMGTFSIPSDRPEIDRITTSVRQQLGDGVFSQNLAEGRAMTLDQAVEYALSERDESDMISW